MKSTGIVRQVDSLGRLVIPIELRKTLKIAEGDSLEVFVDGDKIIFQKYESSEDRERKEEIIRNLKRIGNHSKNDSVKQTISEAIALFGGN